MSNDWPLLPVPHIAVILLGYNSLGSKQAVCNDLQQATEKRFTISDMESEPDKRTSCEMVFVVPSINAAKSAMPSATVCTESLSPASDCCKVDDVSGSDAETFMIVVVRGHCSQSRMLIDTGRSQEPCSTTCSSTHVVPVTWLDLQSIWESPTVFWNPYVMCQISFSSGRHDYPGLLSPG